MNARMNLADFISESLVSIVEGVRNAQEKTGGTKLEPRKVPSGIGATMFITKQDHDNSQGRDRLLKTETVGYSSDPIQRVEFDIAVTAESKKSMEASGEGSVGGAIKVLGVVDIDALKLQGGVEHKREQNDSVISRIRFSVPINFSGVTYPIVLKSESHKSSQP